jgi:hypothetical protein
MAESDLIRALRMDYMKLAPSDRKKKIRELAAESRENKKFIREFFPEFYAEAWPSRSRAAGRRLGSGSRPGLYAKPR